LSLAVVLVSQGLRLGLGRQGLGLGCHGLGLDLGHESQSLGLGLVKNKTKTILTCVTFRLQRSTSAVYLWSFFIVCIFVNFGSLGLNILCKLLIFPGFVFSTF